MVELVARRCGDQHSTVQNWYPGDEDAWRDLYSPDQARYLQGRSLGNLLDAGGNRIGNHVEIPASFCGDVGRLYSVALANLNRPIPVPR